MKVSFTKHVSVDYLYFCLDLLKIWCNIFNDKCYIKEEKVTEVYEGVGEIKLKRSTSL